MSITSCQRHTSQHLSQPLCSSLSIKRRILNIFFHIFTFGIPLLAWQIIKIIHFYSNSVSLPNFRFPHNSDLGYGFESFSPEAKAAFKFANDQLKNGKHIPIDPNIRIKYEGSHMTTPINSQIFRLMDVYTILNGSLQNQTEKKDFEDKEIVKTQNEIMQITFVISILTFKDIMKISETKKVSINKALSDFTYYSYDTAFLCFATYFFIRNGSGNIHYSVRQLPEEYTDKYYQEGSIQNSWRNLFNEYGRFVMLYTRQLPNAQLPEGKIFLHEDLSKKNWHDSLFENPAEENED